MVKLKPILIFTLIKVLIISIGLILAGCSKENIKKYMYTKKHLVGVQAPRPLRNSQNVFDNMVYYIDIRSRIISQYTSWKGVRYKFGGNTKKGIDCSAFVQRTFREQFDLELPRSTYKQREVGKFIPRSNLCIGDLVFFRSLGSSSFRHIGIYIGNNQFVHASTSKGVTISSLDHPYWKKCYNEARRVLNHRYTLYSE